MATDVRPEPLYGPPTEVIEEDDWFEFRHHRPGPAGVAVLESPDGAVWEVDHAAPHLLVSLGTSSLQPDSAGQRWVVAALGGPPMTVADRSTHDRSGPAMPPTDAVSATPVDPSDPVAVMGRIILLADLCADPDLPLLARIAAGVELVVTADREPLGRLLVETGSLPVGALTDLVADVDPDEVDSLRVDLASELAQLCETAAPMCGAPGLVLAHLARSLQPVVDDAAGLDADLVLFDQEFEPDAESWMPPPIEIFPLRAAGPPDDEDEPITVSRPTPTLLRVEAFRSDGPRWVRVFHGDGLVLLAQVPLVAEDLVDVAELVVPPDVETIDLQVVVVDAADIGPGPAYGAVLDTAGRRVVDLVRDAVRTGRDAARANRLGENLLAAVLWARCAELWSSAGDPDRAALAAGMATPPEIGPRVRATLADRIADWSGPLD